MSKIEQAKASWTAGVPDWIEVLARECDATSQSSVARDLNVSATMVHQVINNRYTGDVEKMEQRVRGALMSATVACPVIGEIPANECLNWQDQATRYRNTNQLQIRMFTACRACPQARRDYS